MKTNIENLFKAPKINKSPMNLNFKKYQEFLLHFSKILEELQISLEDFNHIGKKLGLKNIFDYSQLFGVYDYYYEFYDKGNGCNVIYFLNKEMTKKNIYYVYKHLKF